MVAEDLTRHWAVGPANIYWARGFQVIRVPGGTRTGIILDMAGVLKTTSLVQSDRFSENVDFS